MNEKVKKDKNEKKVTNDRIVKKNGRAQNEKKKKDSQNKNINKAD